MLTGTTTTEAYECGAGCGQTFPDFADVFTHACSSTPEWMTAKGLRAGRPVEAHATTRGDSIDAPERRESTGKPPAPRPAMTNRYAGNCQRCGGRVEAGAGHAVKNHAGGRGVSWAVEHKVSECPAIGARETVPAARPVVDTADVTAEPRIHNDDIPRPAADDRRANRYGGACVRCGAYIAAEAGKLVKTGAAWGVDHPAGPCPTVEAPAADVEPEGPVYEPDKGDVHVLDGDFYRIHKGQRSGRFYACRWDGAEWEYAGGVLRRCSTATLATAEDAARFGELYQACVFCTRALDTPESTAVGYGPVCAAKRGLPWGAE